MLNGWRVISENTDGLEAIIPKKDWDKYQLALKSVEEGFNIALEHEKYTKIVYCNVNNYIGVTDSGKVKKKGLFKHGSDIPLGDSVNEQVIPIALEKYFIEGIPVEEVIRKPWEHGIHIYDYCVSKKVSRDFDVIYNNEKQQQLNRYYFSKSGYYLFKRGNDKSKPKSYGKDQHMHKGVGVKIFNKFEELPWEDYKIDYSYYIAKANTLIKELEKDIRQLTLF